MCASWVGRWVSRMLQISLKWTTEVTVSSPSFMRVTIFLAASLIFSS